jgi:hypothetical protein
VPRISSRVEFLFLNADLETRRNLKWVMKLAPRQ